MQRSEPDYVYLSENSVWMLSYWDRGLYLQLDTGTHGPKAVEATNFTRQVETLAQKDRACLEEIAHT